ncbi:MAG TPA: phosphate acyltransferase [Elusimicrobiales bacterium]|nr:phosphate acyltransferase [Elusimicrobiales bacterium]HOL62043.1 phosphate acyltransferase [Elusimicrobiales bacterium]HPO95326.1 phosphate acyltransferase [Elusimicrobiales bacterium]
MIEFKSYDELIKQVSGMANRVVVPGANNIEVLEALKMGTDYKLISGGTLIGPKDEVSKYMKELNLPEIFELRDEKDVLQMSNIAVELIKEGKADFLVKGLVDTKYYMKAILRKDIGAVKEGGLISHFVLFKLANYHKFFALTDAAIVIKPTLEEKVQIINNSVEILRLIGVENPKVSIVCPVEKPNPKIQSTMDAVELVKMNKEGKIKNCVIEGPYDIYITFSKKLALEKGVKDGAVPGDADLVVLDDLDAANATYKAISFFGAGFSSATILAGANFPIILPSRTDSPMTKLYSIALASYMQQKTKARAK